METLMRFGFMLSILAVLIAMLHQLNYGLIVAVFCIGVWFIWFLLNRKDVLLGTKYKEQKNKMMVVIVGAGFSGICAGIQFKMRKIPFVIMEQALSIGGTWWYNKYPGCACDLPSYQYSFSFYKYEWSRMLPVQSETLNYLKEACAHFGLNEHIELDTKVTGCVFDDKNQTWTVSTSKGETITCSHLVSAIGGLNIPKYPDLPGINDFTGDSIHTARWPVGYDLSEKRVAVIGTGCSAAQVIPSIVGKVRELLVFQRSAAWVVAAIGFKVPQCLQQNNRLRTLWNSFVRCVGFIMGDFSVKFVLTKSSNFVSRAIRNALKKDMERQIGSEELKKKLIPKDEFGTKRCIIKGDYLPCFNNPKVQLIEQKITRVTPNGIETADTKSYSVDTIIYATGYDSLASMKNLNISRNGKTLGGLWNDYPNAYNGVMYPGFPNFFILLGPNTILAHNAVIFMIECQVNFMLSSILKTIQNNATTIEVTEKANTNYQNNLQSTMKKLTFNGENGCKSWYVNPKGINFTLWPMTLTHYWNLLRKFKMDHFVFK